MKYRRIIKSLAIWLTALSIIGSAWAAQTVTGSVFSASMLVKVTDPERTADLLVEKAAAMGGYFVLRDNNYIKVKIPSAAMEDFHNLAADQGLLLSRELNSEDVNTSLVQKKALLKSKTAIKDQYITVLKEAKAESVVMVENEITGLVHEIEILKGEIRMIEHRLAFSEVVIRFSFKDRSAPTAQGPSSFPWLNNVQLSDLLRVFQYDHHRY